MNSDAEINYHWQCRRGMLELDILLNNFVDKKINDLTQQQKQSLELLLSYPDQTLFDLLMGKSISSDSSIATLVQQIRTTELN